jgi:hypothetical protein
MKNFREFVAENMDHSKDHQAVPELRAALMANKEKINNASEKEVYGIIDKIMIRIAKSHGLSGQKLHDMWVKKYKQIPDTWIMKESVVGLPKVKYNKFDAEEMSDKEHNETVHQSRVIHSGEMSDVHPAIAKAIHGFAKDKKSFTDALRKSKIEKIERKDNVNNSEIGQPVSSVENKTKLRRVTGMIKSGKGIDRPIVLRHTDKNGNVHRHLLAGNTRATSVGYGVEAHHINV